jgi:hypothetical protein
MKCIDIGIAYQPGVDCLCSTSAVAKQPFVQRDNDAAMIAAMPCASSCRIRHSIGNKTRNIEAVGYADLKMED